jgi:hypothetical protein
MTGAGPSTTPTSSGSPGSRPRVHQHAGGRHVARHIGVDLASTPAPTGTITTHAATLGGHDPGVHPDHGHRSDRA